jgi:hypothetical protein
MALDSNSLGFEIISGFENNTGSGFGVVKSHAVAIPHQLRRTFTQ